MSLLNLGKLNDAKQSERSPDTHLDESVVRRADGQGSALPPAIAELRAKIAGLTPAGASGQVQSRASEEAVPTFGTFKFGYFPGRGLLYSAIGHELALFGLFLIFTYGFPALRSQKLVVRMNTQDHVIYLPELGGGSEGEKSPGGGQSSPQPTSAAPARASRGFAYPGAQAILSDPPNPNNAFQTVLRPLLVHPEPIRKLTPLPNLVQMGEMRLPSDLIAPKAAMPQHLDIPKPIRVKQDSTTHRDAKWKIPVTDSPKLQAQAEMPKLQAAEPPIPEAPKTQPEAKPQEQKQEIEKPSPKPMKVTAEKRAEKPEKEVAPPTAAQVARMEMHGKEKEPILSLSPMPTPTLAKIPAGEARGRFAIAPGGTLNPNSITPGKTDAVPSITPGTGQENSHAPNATNEVASNLGNGTGHNASAGGGAGNAREASGLGSAGTGTGSGKTSGAGAGGAGEGRGRGSAGKGAGSNGGHGAGTGSGAGSGSGTGSFPGITIQGGEQGNASGNSQGFTVEPQESYGITVVSTAASGGGLEDYGVFDNERIFTVYIPMKRGPEEADPTWTLQYAVLKDDLAGTADPQVVPPTAVICEWPQIPAELERKYAQRQVVVYAIIDKEGKVGHIAVKTSPDPRVSDAIVQALAKWVFRPAKADNQPVSVKILIGIPL
jgi:outer membrane biosynthesis protein TonB